MWFLRKGNILDNTNICQTMQEVIKTIEDTSQKKNLNEQELSECIYYLAKAIGMLLETK